MKKVERVADFPANSCITFFYGKSYEEALELAMKSPLPLISYYEQPRFGGTKIATIIACYVDGKHDIFDIR